MDLSIVPRRLQQLKSDRHTLETSDDHAMLKQVEDTDHAPDDHAMLKHVEDTDHAPDDHAMLKHVEDTDHAPDDHAMLKQVEDTDHAPDDHAMLKQVEDTDHSLGHDHAMLKQVEVTDHAPDDHAMLKQVEVTHAPDDHAMLKQVEDTDHAPDGGPFAVKPILNIIRKHIDEALPRQFIMKPIINNIIQNHLMLKQVETTYGRQFAVKPVLNITRNYLTLKQVEATHSPDGRQLAVKPLLDIIDDIFQCALPSVPGFDQQGSTQAQSDSWDYKTFQSVFFDMLYLLQFTINKVSSEIWCKCTGVGDARTTILAIFNTLANHSWDAKVVLAMAAFALHYGKFWMIVQLYPTDPSAKSIALLKQLPEILKRADTLKSKFEAISNLIKAMLEVAKCIVEFKELQSQNISPDIPEIVTATAHIPTAVYWTIRSIVACSTQFMAIVGMGHEYTESAEESLELSSLANKVNSIHTHLKNQLDHCYKIIDEKRQIERYQALVRIMETPHDDNMNYLRALIYDKDDPLPLFDGSTMQMESLNVLSRKNVLLLISDLDQDELFILEYMYQESPQHSTRSKSRYEMVWMPVVDRTVPWTEEKQAKFDLLLKMPWYSIHHPSMVDPAVITYIKEFWHFKKTPIIVALDPHGKVVNTNAFHMMWIWGSLAFPFTRAKEEALWREESWRLELLVVDSAIPFWEHKRKFVCLYGGEDIDWIRKFTKAAQRVAQGIGLPLEMLYVGKSNSKDKKVRENITTIASENLSHTLKDILLISFFWVRLESMWHSKMQHCSNNLETDPILQEIATILSFDGNNNCWAAFYRGSEMAKAKGETILKSFDNFHLWKKNANDISFIPALNQHLHEVHTPDHCNHLVLPGVTGTFPERVVCSECNRQMEKFIMYRCCN